MSSETASEDVKNKNLTQIIYGLYAAAVLGIPTNIVAIIMNYIKREDVAGTMYESHFSWQIRTFWWSLLWGVIGTILIVAFGLGIIVLGVLFIWYVYRIVKGWLRLSENKPM
jgi:uncharacterized membrane protein